MCCRYLLEREHLAAVLTRLGLRVPDASLFRTRYNIPPAGPVPAIRIRPHPETANVADLEVLDLHWGLIPGWAGARQGFGANLANARAETVTEKPAFRTAWKRRQRCLLPASGFYEWEKAGRERRPWLFRRSGGDPFCFAGLWDAWCDPADGARVESCTLLTTAPNARLARIHDRMPVLLDLAAALSWLQAPAAEASQLLQPFPAEQMSEQELIPRVNHTVHDDAACLTPAAPRAPEAQLGLGF